MIKVPVGSLEPTVRDRYREFISSQGSRLDGDFEVMFLSFAATSEGIEKRYHAEPTETCDPIANQ